VSTVGLCGTRTQCLPGRLLTERIVHMIAVVPRIIIIIKPHPVAGLSTFECNTVRLIETIIYISSLKETLAILNQIMLVKSLPLYDAYDSTVSYGERSSR
jgi:hypothetical protein